MSYTIEVKLDLIVSLGIMFLGLGLLIVIILAAVQTTYEQTALSSFSRLGSAIDEACFKELSKDNAIEMNVELPQNVWFAHAPLIGPISESLVGRFVIKAIGEPRYILYYEMFPVGEAVAWEMYHDMDQRIVSQLDEKNNDIEKLISAAKDKRSSKNEKLEGAFVNNILLGNIDPTTGTKMKEPLGKWESGKFTFTNPPIDSYNKTMSKYLSCGDNTLCLKTSKAVNTYPLKYCKNMDYIQFVYDSPDEHMRYSDFYLASPCKIKAKIFVDDCADGHRTTFLDSLGGCENNITYPIYSYNEKGESKIIGSHTSCLDFIAVKKEAAKPEHLPCVRIVLSNEDGFCFTNNPKTSWLKWAGITVGAAAGVALVVVAAVGAAPITVAGFGTVGAVLTATEATAIGTAGALGISASTAAAVINYMTPVTYATEYVNNMFLLKMAPSTPNAFIETLKPDENWIWP
ncbi:MAG: hypothetical protein V1900_00095 [Candidatus Aenigmatarchaeota archaeon]